MTRTVERFPVGRARGARRRPTAARVSDATVSAVTTPRRTRPNASRSENTHNGNNSNNNSPALTPSAVGARLTAKQRLVSTLYNLDMDVTALRQQINELTLHRSLLHTRALYSQRDLDGSAVKKAKGYFHAFRRGFREPDVAAVAYLASVADEDLQLGLTDLGRDMLLEQWRRYTAYFAIREYDIRTVRVIASETDSNACIVRGEGVFHGTFTRQALEIAFPTVLQDPWLTQELLGRALVTPVAFNLHFDDHGRFVRHDGEVDLFAALADTLGDPVRAAAIMERAHIAEEGMLDAPDDEVLVEPVARIARVKRSRVAPSHAYQDDDDDERGGYVPGGSRFAREPDYEPDDHHDDEGLDVYFVEL